MTSGMPELRQQDLLELPEAGAGDNQRLHVQAPPMPEPNVLQDLHVGAEGGGPAPGGGAGGGDAGASDRSADAFFRADARAQGLSLDEYKRKYGILIRAGDDLDRPRWRGTTSDPFEREVGWADLDGQRPPMILSLDMLLEDEAA